MKTPLINSVSEYINFLSIKIKQKTKSIAAQVIIIYSGSVRKTNPKLSHSVDIHKTSVITVIKYISHGVSLCVNYYILYA